MRRFLQALLLPIIIISALNWRTIYTVVRFSLFPPHLVTVSQAKVDEQPDNTLSITSIGVTAPIIDTPADPTIESDWNVLKENLTKGVGLAEKLPAPGQPGTTMIIGHSSDWTPHAYSAIFAGLNNLGEGQEIDIRYHGVSYRYKVREKQVVRPSNLNYFRHTLGDVKDKNQLALVTCWPVLSTANRLVVVSDLIKS